MYHLQIEEAALKKEKDKMSKQRLEEVRKELAGINEKLAPLLAEYKKCARGPLTILTTHVCHREKAVLDELRALQKKRDELQVRLEQAQARMDLAMVADIKYGSLAETEEQIAYKQGQVGADGHWRRSMDML